MVNPRSIAILYAVAYKYYNTFLCLIIRAWTKTLSTNIAVADVYRKNDQGLQKSTSFNMTTDN